jgi:fructose-bisphosphate aldolase class II
MGQSNSRSKNPGVPAGSYDSATARAEAQRRSTAERTSVKRMSAKRMSAKRMSAKRASSKPAAAAAATPPSQAELISLKDAVGTGVITGDNLFKLFSYARANQFAIPAVNVTTTSTCNAVLEAARDLNSPIIIQCSQGGAQFFAGKGLDNSNQAASVAGAVSMALHVRNVAKMYDIPVVLHSDHCAKKLLPWFEGMLEADEAYFAENGEPLFSSHMLDLSEEVDTENISTCVKYFERMSKMKQWLEMEIGITGGEEDGVDNTGVTQDRLYTKPEQIFNVYRALSAISPNFSIAAAFGNVHGVYQAGNVKLSPEILGVHQEFVRDALGDDASSLNADKPCFFVFHGGSGSSPADIAVAVSHGVIKFNIDTDTQWAYWAGILNYYKKFEAYLQATIGNPEGEDKPNKKKYDPRVWLRACEATMSKRVEQACADLANVATLAIKVAPMTMN